MAVKKVDRWIRGFDTQPAIVLSETSDSTASKTIKAFLIAEDGTEYKVGTETGAAAGTDISILLDFGVSGLTVNTWYELRIGADLDQANKMLLLPNSNTAAKVMVYLALVPTDA